MSDSFRFLPIALALVFTTLSAAQPFIVIAKGSSNANEAVNYHPQSDPGPMPQVNVSDYSGQDPAIRGSSVLSGKITLSLASGEEVVCRHQDVYLYPDSRFTRWMVAKMAVDRDRKTGGLGEPWIDPNEYRYVPAILNGWGKARVVLRDSVCSGDGRFVFKDVPPGNYFVETTVIRYGGAYSDGPSGTLVLTDTPDGPQTSIQGSSVLGGRAPSDDYLVVSKFAIAIKPGSPQSITFAPTDFNVIAHAFE